RLPEPGALTIARAPESHLPERPPFVIRARVLTPLAGGGTRFEADGYVAVDAEGRIDGMGAWSERGTMRAARADAAAHEGRSVFDVRPWVVTPGLVDLHVHLPQVPAAGVGAGLDLLTWLERYIFPLERAFDEATAERVAPHVFGQMARAGTTTALMYGAIWQPSLDATFRAAEAHGIRAVIGKVMMDERTYDERLPPDRILEVSLRQSAELCERWHMRDRGRLRYAFTPRFALSCSEEMLRESARLAREMGAYWQTHLSEDRGEIAEVTRRFPKALDYLDVYDRAGALGERTILAHAVHLSERELSRLVESGSRIAHCPASNLFLASGVMPLGRYLERGAIVGLGSDVAGGPELSMISQMRAGAYAQSALRTVGRDPRPVLEPLDWWRLATLDGARALGMEDEIGSLEPGKDADLICIDPTWTEPLRAGAGPKVAGAEAVESAEGEEVDPAEGQAIDPAELASRLIFRYHPEMVRGAWVRGRRLPRGAEAVAR
ncbi:MAG: guanine deaminase, partial [Chloroflexi bacterium]|nr:guanine deaminase [Chloroflexota bacterium]